MRGRCMLISVLGAFAASITFAQQHRALSIVDTVPLREDRPLAVIEPVKCGSEGQVLVRFASADSEDVVGVISADGKRVWWAGMREAPEQQDSVLTDDAVSPDGEVFLLSTRTERPRGPVRQTIVKFKADGTYDSTVKLDTSAVEGLLARQLGVFGSGDFLVSGFVANPFKPVVAIFDSSGRFQRNVVLPSEDSQNIKKRGSAESRPGVTREQELAFQVDVSWIQSTDDGRLFLIRHTPEGPMFLMTPGGSVKQIRLQPPKENLHLINVKVSNRIIATEYMLPVSNGLGQHFLMLTDAGSGKTSEVIPFERGSSLAGPPMVCYKDQVFTFLSSVQSDPSSGVPEHLQLVRAMLR